MFIKSKIDPETRIQRAFAFGPIAWLAFALSAFLGRLHNPDLDFIIGFLTGISIVGNMVYIFVATRYYKQNRR